MGLPGLLDRELRKNGLQGQFQATAGLPKQALANIITPPHYPE